MKTTISRPIAGIVSYVIQRIRSQKDTKDGEDFTTREKLVNYLKTNMAKFKNLYMMKDRFIAGYDDEIISGVSAAFF